MAIPIQQATTVVDVTYLCNAKCKYCQWGNPKNHSRRHLKLQHILIPYDSIKALRTKRIVLSGGEPRLHPQLPRILAYYRKCGDSLIVLTNGYGLSREEISKLREMGATGVTVSLDSVSSYESMETRETPFEVHQQLITDLIEVCRQPREFELGINSVVSHVTANWETVRGILEFAQKLRLDFVKFQPIFDDGYVVHNTPHLMLSSADYANLKRIEYRLETIEHPPTNPPGFWNNIGDLVTGKKLSSSSCSLGTGHSIAVGQDLKVCYWLKNSYFGKTYSSLKPSHAEAVRRNFEIAKLGCKVGFHCFCMQDISHIWDILVRDRKLE
jgi:molybdenum cofactor biosynthesis enzyme MoaA